MSFRISSLHSWNVKAVVPAEVIDATVGCSVSETKPQRSAFGTKTSPILKPPASWKTTPIIHINPWSLAITTCARVSERSRTTHWQLARIAVPWPRRPTGTVLFFLSAWLRFGRGLCGDCTEHPRWLGGNADYRLVNRCRGPAIIGVDGQRVTCRYCDRFSGAGYGQSRTHLPSGSSSTGKFSGLHRRSCPSADVIVPPIGVVTGGDPVWLATAPSSSIGRPGSTDRLRRHPVRGCDDRTVTIGHNSLVFTTRWDVHVFQPRCGGLHVRHYQLVLRPASPAEIVPLGAALVRSLFPSSVDQTDHPTSPTERIRSPSSLRYTGPSGQSMTPTPACPPEGPLL